MRAATTRELLIFMAAILIVLAGCVAIVRAEDLPQPPAITEQTYALEIGRLHIQLNQAVEYVNTLRTKLDAVTKERDELREKVKKYESE